VKCPFCGAADSRVVDSRLAREGSVVRRRRECPPCGRRFTTYEQVDEQLPQVVKRDGRREPFSRTKLLDAVRRACVKRSVADEALHALVERVTQRSLEEGAAEVASAWIAERALAELRTLDPVSFVRFASVCRRFERTEDFVALVQVLEAGPAPGPEP